MPRRRGRKASSPDPSGLAAVDPANPQTRNAYAHLANQPLTATDPLGLVSDSLGIGGGPCDTLVGPCGGGSSAAPQFLTPCVNDIPLAPSSAFRGNVALAGGSASADVLSGMVLEYLGLDAPGGGGSFSVIWGIGDFVPIYEEVDFSIVYKLPTL